MLPTVTKVVGGDLQEKREVHMLKRMFVRHLLVRARPLGRPRLLSEGGGRMVSSKVGIAEPPSESRRQLRQTVSEANCH